MEESYTDKEWLMVQNHAKLVTLLKQENADLQADLEKSAARVDKYSRKAERAFDKVDKLSSIIDTAHTKLCNIKSVEWEEVTSELQDLLEL